MATTQFNNRLITPELTEALSSYPLYSQDAKKKDALCIAVFPDFVNVSPKIRR